MADDLKRLKDVRAAYKGHCTRSMTKAEGIMSSTNPDRDELQNLLEAVSLRREKISLEDQRIENSVEPTDIESEIQGALEYNDKLTAFENKVRRFL